MSETNGQKLIEQLEFFTEQYKVNSSYVRRCTKCNELKDITSFPYREASRKARRKECRECNNESATLLKKLKIENPFPKAKNYKCPCCLKTEKELRERISDRKKTFWVLDHCHTTGKFRGYICDYCNTSIARSFEDPETLRRQADYLEYHRYV